MDFWLHGTQEGISDDAGSYSSGDGDSDEADWDESSTDSSDVEGEGDEPAAPRVNEFWGSRE